ncbi:MAG: peptide chain release factor 2 [Candidatus Saccharimonadales bacterium]
MQELISQLSELQSSVTEALKTLQISQLENELASLAAKSQQADFWSDQIAAQATMKQQSNLQARIEPWRELEKQISDALELAELNDASVEVDLQKQLKILNKQLQGFKRELQFNGPYDDLDAIVSIHAGAGGTDAQDWAQMLLRMYVRWAEQQKLKVEVIDQANGDEAGLKSVTFEISGPFAYGKLQGEHGVHRLVRLSPFNSDNLRQTSFAKIEVLPKVETADKLEIDDKDLKIDVYRSGGKGGQSVNTTDSAVRITHIPSGITVAIQNERSQLQNRETAMTILRSRLAQLQLEQHQEKLAGIKGPNQSAEWGNQIRSYVLHPYKQVKDLRTKHETSDAEAVLDGKLQPFIDAYLENQLTNN